MYALARPNSDNIKFPLDSFSDRSELASIPETYVNPKQRYVASKESNGEKNPFKNIAEFIA